MKEQVVAIERISKAYLDGKTSVEAVHDITVHAHAEEIVGIMGPSGCGKSTLMKIIAGIETASSGRLTLFGQDCTAKMPQTLKRRMGFVYQDSNLLPWRTVEANLRFPLEVFGLARQKEYEDRISEALEIVGLSDYRSCLPQELSGGMIQRVGIARALAFNPDVLLMDQPFGALDAITRRKLRFDFLRIFAQTRKTIIIVTNSIDEALLFSNRILVMTESPGTVQELVEVDIPMEERTSDIADNSRFTELRHHMIEIVKSQYARKEMACD